MSQGWLLNAQAASCLLLVTINLAGCLHSSRLFGAIHCIVGIPEHIFRTAIAFGIYRYADAGGDVKLAAADRKRRCQLFPDSPGDFCGVSSIPNTIKKNRELIAANPRQNIFARLTSECRLTGCLRDRAALANRPDKSFGNLNEQFVTCRVAETVVHRLEVIEIHKEDGKPIAPVLF